MTSDQERHILCDLLSKRIPEKYGFVVLLYEDDGGTTMVSNIDEGDLVILLLETIDSLGKRVADD